MARVRSLGRRARRAVAVVLGGTAVVAVVQASGSAGPPPQSAAAVSADAVPAERGSLCRLQPEAIRQLRTALPGSEAEVLRDAVALLEERVEQWRGGAEGLPQAAVPVRLAADVEAAWREALERHDAGDAAAARSALARGEARLGELGHTLRATPLPTC